MSIQDQISELTEASDLDNVEIDLDDVEAHGAKEWIAGLSTAVVIGGAGAGMAAASFSPDPRGTAHAAVDVAFDTADTGVDLATSTAKSAQDTATTTAAQAQAAAEQARDAAFDAAHEAVDTLDEAVDNAYATVDSLTGPVRDAVNDIIENKGGVVTSTRVISTLPRSFAGQSITLTAAVTGQEARTELVSGRVTFLAGSQRLGTVALTPGGVATFTTDDLKAGEHQLRAVFHGNDTYSGSVSRQAEQDVVKATTATVLRSSAAHSALGSTVRLTATVASAHPGALMPTGSVTFWDGDIQLGVGRIGPDGTATISTDALGVGVHSVVAQYAGDARSAASESLAMPQAVVDEPSAGVTLQDGRVTVTASVMGNDISISSDRPGQL